MPCNSSAAATRSAATAWSSGCSSESILSADPGLQSPSAARTWVASKSLSEYSSAAERTQSLVTTSVHQISASAEIASGGVHRPTRLGKVPPANATTHAVAISASRATAIDVTDDTSYHQWTNGFERWRSVTKEALRSIATNDESRDEFNSATGHLFRRMGQTERDTFAYRRDVIPKGITSLEGFVDRLEFVESMAAEPRQDDERNSRTGSRSVFVVHGRDEGIRDRVARTLTALGFDPIILAEQANEGRTLIEKFEAKSDVGFAVVILTPEDYGRGPDDSGFPEAPNRARQNAILELGYFIGKLGRKRVCPLYVSGTERPSDIDGLAYVPIDDAGMWRFKLGTEWLPSTTRST